MLRTSDRDRRAERAALEDPGKDLGAVGFVALRGEAALAGAAAVEVALDVVDVVRARRGGQPSTTTPTPPPCDSPNVVMRKSVPKVLDIERRIPPRCGGAAGRSRGESPVSAR